MKKKQGNEYYKRIHFREICPKCKETRDFITPRNGIGFSLFCFIWGPLFGNALYHATNWLHTLMGIRCEFCGTSADKIIQNQPISNVPIKASLGKNANFDFKKEKPIQNLRTLQKGDPFYCSKHKLQKVLNEEGTLYECPDCSKPLIPQCPTHRVGMILKNGRYGPFYGCPTFPKCKETRDAPNPINKNFMQ